MDLVDIGQCWENGVMPVMGGYLDQTNAICEAVKYLKREQSDLKRQLMERAAKR